MFLIESHDVDTFRLDSDLPTGAQWALDVVTVPDSLQSAVTTLLVDVVLVEDLETADKVIAGDRRLRVFTRNGDSCGWGWTSGGPRTAHSAVELQVAIEEARKNEKAALNNVEKAQAALRGAEDDYRLSLIHI